MRILTKNPKKNPNFIKEQRKEVNLSNDRAEKNDFFLNNCEKKKGRYFFKGRKNRCQFGQRIAKKCKFRQSFLKTRISSD